MSGIASNISSIRRELPSDVRLVAVSKYRPVQELQEAYDAGQRIFAESRPLEFEQKVKALPSDIEWHFIGHLQTNKLRNVLPYVSLVHSVDSEHLLEAINRWAAEHGKLIDVLLEVHIGAEETKQGFTGEELLRLLAGRISGGDFPCVRVRGLMGMATNTDDESCIDADFSRIKALFDEIRSKYIDLAAASDNQAPFSEQLAFFSELSIGMSADWRIALRHGATMVRIGTAIFLG